MNDMKNPPMPQRVLARLLESAQRGKWEDILESMLAKLELDQKTFEQAKRAYTGIADHIANHFQYSRQDVHIVPQGSMRTRTTIPQRGNTKFDLDVVVKLTGPGAHTLSHSELFEAVGAALDSLPEEAGEPTPKNRCWRVPMPNEKFYFDVTPALPDTERTTGAALKVPDRRRDGWAPSNPEEFAAEVDRVAALRFEFQERRQQALIEARAKTEPLPNAPVPLDDVLRRVIQLSKLHRDNFYWYESERAKDEAPISVIIVTLAMAAYEHLAKTRNSAMTSNIEVALEVIALMPSFIKREGDKYFVCNPALRSENFADRWNERGSTRPSEFYRWHGKLEQAIELLFEGEPTQENKDKVQASFGSAGLEAFIAAHTKPAFLSGLLATAPGAPRTNPAVPVPPGKSNTLA